MNFKALCATVALLASPLSNAAFVTIQDLSPIYSQSSFGNTPIDIRIGAVTQLVRPDLLDITTDAEVSNLFSQHVGGKSIVNFYFIDTISACGGTVDVNIIGCGQVVGNNFVVESTWAADTTIPAGGSITFGQQLLAHELGHNLGLQHRSGNDLMNPFVNGFGTLNATEVNTILGSPLVQTDANGHLFIEIDPVLVVASAVAHVPEPSPLMLLVTALFLAGLQMRKSKRRA